MAAPDPRNPKSSISSALTVLIVGGYGTFGGRLVELLAQTRDLTLLVGGRSIHRAQAFCERTKIPDGATLVPVECDRAGDIAAILKALNPGLVVDASGPFQIYDDDREPYRVVRAAIAQGIDYIDLADASGFVSGISILDDDARSRGVFALAGVSSFPVLTCAVVRALSHDLASLRTVTAGIAPSPYAGVGRNVIQAIASYSGKKIPIRRDGRDTTAFALTESLRYTITVPGKIPLKPIRFSLVDVPDLRIIPEIWPEVATVWVGAGPVPEILHRMLNGLARLVKWRLLPTISVLAPLMNLAMNNVRWGDHRGGMFIRIEGTGASGRDVSRFWHMIAEGDDGSCIPSMAAEAIIRKCLAGKQPGPGARPAHGDLDITDYEQMFAGRDIALHTGEQQPENAGKPLYARLLADAWHTLPEQIRELHDVTTIRRFSGRANVTGATQPVPALIARLFGFPKTALDIPVLVTLQTDGTTETWTRNFDGHKFQSTQEAGTGRNQGLLVERFGPFAFGLALVLKEAELHLDMQRWTAFGVPMPAWAAPRSEAFELVHDGRFRFSVKISLPLIGTLVRYRGWLEHVEV